MAAVIQQARSNSAVPLTKLSLHSQWAALSIRENLARVQLEATAVPTKSADIHHLLPIAGIRPSPDNISDVTGFKVGIIGAGAAGLFTAMLFDYLNDKYPGLNVQYEILEAETKRVGGRLFTYKFPQRPDQPKIGPHDYYDVGAMRFPKVTTMKRTYALFDLLGMRPADDPIKPKAGDLIPYYFTGPNQPTLYNGIQVVQKDGQPALSAKTFQVPDLPPTAQDTAAGALIDDRIQWLKTLYESNAEVFWDTLRKQVDPYSVRQYLTTQVQPAFDYKTLEFCETLNFGNRWYDQAASEMVLESLDFDAKANWYCIEGGAAEIAKNMRKSLKDQKVIELGKVVKEISYHKTDKDTIDVNVTIDGESAPRPYDAVFNSAPLGAMQHMHLEGLNLSWGVKSAIRSLGYGASCKVGIRFKSLWWISKLNITQGGQGKTDLPIRCCVYPSYNFNDPKDEPGVLLVSYTWSQEAERIGALIDRKSPENENELKNLLFHDLARLHSPTKDDEKYKELYNLIHSEYLDHYAYNWYNNPRTVGAFAWFGPGQFNGWYNDLTQSDGKYIVIGEAASAHHAWVVGSLESAVRGVYQFLWKNSGKSKAAKAATRDYNKGNIPTPFGPLPAEYSRTNDIHNPGDFDVDEDDMPSAIGDLARWQVVLETLRQKQQKDVLDPDEITKTQLGSFSEILVKG